MEIIYTNKDLIKAYLTPRPIDGHKGTFGKVNIIAGSLGYTGAPIFASHSAVRGGTGLVFLQVPECIYNIIAVKSNEAMPFPVKDLNGKMSLSAYDAIMERSNSCDAILLGCGMGRSFSSDLLIKRLISDIEKPLVIDADGLNALSSDISILKSILKNRKNATILTPHDGEFSRLTGSFPPSNIIERRKIAYDFANKYNCILVLKGHKTIVTDGQNNIIYENTTGNSGMAKGGSGDVLAGLILSFLGQKISPIKAAISAVYIHGRSGDICSAKYTAYSMTPSDMILTFSDVFKELQF